MFNISMILSEWYRNFLSCNTLECGQFISCIFNYLVFVNDLIETRVALTDPPKELWDAHFAAPLSRSVAVIFMKIRLSGAKFEW
jgi:hypothetical protein